MDKEGAWEKSIEKLNQLCLVSYIKFKESITFHPVMHACIRETIEHQQDVRQAAMLILAQSIQVGGREGEFEFQ
jgi:hypothetical protein